MFEFNDMLSGRHFSTRQFENSDLLLQLCRGFNKGRRIMGSLKKCEMAVKCLQYRSASTCVFLWLCVSQKGTDLFQWQLSAETGTG